MSPDDDVQWRAAERARIEDRLARARRRLDQCGLILAEQRLLVAAAEETGVRVADAQALLRIFEDSHRQSTQDRDRVAALLAALDGEGGVSVATG